MSRDFDKAQEMVLASMEYVKILGCRIRRTEVQRDDWKLVAQSHADELIKLRQRVDELKAERDAERKAHDEYKERNREIFNGNQRLTAELAVIKDERDALRAECDSLRRVLSMVRGSLGINQGEHIGNAIDALKKERDDLTTRLRQSIARGDFAEMRQAQDMRAEIERLKKPRQHPVAVGEWVECILTDACDQRHPLYRIGSKGRVGRIVERPNYIFEYHVTIGSDQVWWESSYCIPCDPPEATHDMPEGKQAAESAVKREPKPGDVVRLIRQCEGWDPIWGRIGDLGTVLRITTYQQGTKGVTIREKGGLDWPLSYVEIVEDAK